MVSLCQKKARVAPVPPTWQDLVASTLKTLKEQPAVTGVWWLPIQEGLQNQPEGQEETAGAYG